MCIRPKNEKGIIMTNIELGKKGEKVASNFLEKLGYCIILRNFKCSYGEIDIIAMDKKELVFIEVKTRGSKKYGEAREAVDLYKKKHIKKATTYYISKHRLENEFVRFDIIEVYVRRGEFNIKHVKNA